MLDRVAARIAAKEIAREHHPDVPGGSHEEMAELNAARDRALAEIG